MGEYSIGNYKFDSEEEYKAARKDFELIRAIRNKYDLKDPKIVRVILDKYKPQSVIGERFVNYLKDSLPQEKTIIDNKMLEDIDSELSQSSAFEKKQSQKSKDNETTRRQSRQNMRSSELYVDDEESDVEDLQGKVVFDKWIWSLATIPMAAGLFLPVLGITGLFSTIIIVVLNVVFLSLDCKEVRDAGYDIDKWLYLGIALVPVYIFVRESKTNRNWAPGIVWCVLFILSLF